MGCHTWFFNLTKETLKSARKNAENNYNKYKFQLPLYKQKFIEANFDQISIFEDWYTSDSIKVVDPRGVYQEVEYHDIFRVRNYPGIRLYTLDETYEFINDNNITEVHTESLKSFWEKYPLGMIQFG